MAALYVCLSILAILAVVAVISYICFRMAFYVRPRKPEEGPPPPVLGLDFLTPYRDQLREWTRQTKEMPCREFTVRSFDGLTLYGRYYECDPHAPIELMMHGYRGMAERDLCGGVQRCFALGRNALIVDQRACGKSQGRVITFGVREHRDCLSWVELLCREFPNNAIILTGISMGASSVLMAAGEELPDQVIGVLADCGYTSAREIIQKVIRSMKLPPRLAYPFVQLGALLYGGFLLDAKPAVEAVKRCKKPVLFIHGEADDFVPCDMSRANYEACASRKRLFTVPDAGHGLSYLVDMEGYFRAVREFDYLSE